MKTLQVVRLDDPSRTDDKDIIDYMETKGYTWLSSSLVIGKKNFFFTTIKRCGPKTVFNVQEELQSVLQDDTISVDFA